ncbi:hypothetical protein N431DRAFT_94267 [Stipitochalara longipes BDJ]|nr:hypothetical protein N431DRAFT_94267 [Stipitochalara longipes BDJ]
MSLSRTLLFILGIAIASTSAQRMPLSQNASILTTQPRSGAYNTNNTTLTTPRQIIDSTWHPRKISLNSFTTLKTLQKDRLEIVTHPSFSVPVLIKLASLHEATAYRLLHGSGATPEFLGFVTEDSQAIGFITEYIDIESEPELSREERVRGKQGCLTALHALHERGIAHGDAHDGNCMVRSNGSSVLIDFELFLETWEKEEFERDLDIMERCIEQALLEGS